MARCGIGSLGTILVALVVLALVAVTLVVATFAVFTLSVAVSERIHRWQADRHGFGRWLAEDRRLADDGLVDVLRSPPTADHPFTAAGPPVLMEVECLDDPDLRLPLGTELAPGGARLRIWSAIDDPRRADVVVVHVEGSEVHTVEPVGTEGWLDRTIATRRLPVVHAHRASPGLVATDLPTLRAIPATVDDLLPSWPGPPDDVRLTVPLIDGCGAWVQAHGTAATFLGRDDEGRVVAVGAAFGDRCRPAWRPDQNSST